LKIRFNENTWVDLIPRGDALVADPHCADPQDRREELMSLCEGSETVTFGDVLEYLDICWEVA
jgi:hypothetical protein